MPRNYRSKKAAGKTSLVKTGNGGSVSITDTKSEEWSIADLDANIANLEEALADMQELKTDIEAL